MNENKCEFCNGKAGARPSRRCRCGRNRLTGRIGEAIYLGSGSKYEVDLADGSKAIVRSTLEADSFSIGDEVEVLFAGSDVKLLADDDRPT